MSAESDRTAWMALALDLPRVHDDLTAGEAGPFQARLAALPSRTPADFAALGDEAARLLALDVFMVDAMVRRHRLDVPKAAADVLSAALAAAAGRLGCEPILSYPFYIRHNPTDIDTIRRFTSTEAEFRFIRMHRLIEDTFDRLIATLDAVLGAADPRAALAGVFDDIAEAFRLTNRTVAGFRDPVRMPRDVFNDGFRPYFGPRVDPVTGQAVLEGPSGLQSPSFRLVCMQLGYRDAVLDGWTTKIGRYHEPATRAQLARVMSERDAGRSLSGVADSILGAMPSLPHLHPGFAAHIPALTAIAQRERFVTADVLEAFAEFDLRLGVWPEGAPEPGPLPAQPPLPALNAADHDDLLRLATIEAMLFGFHLEHVAITAYQIGHVRGTGGTSGAEFLLMATFRRAFPRLWETGQGG